MSAASAALGRRPALHVNRNAVLALVSIAQFMIVLDSTIVKVALPTIKRGLGFSEQSLSWILNGYTLVFGGFLQLRAPDRGESRQELAVTAPIIAMALQA
jgi:MFS family permease